MFQSSHQVSNPVPSPSFKKQLDRNRQMEGVLKFVVTYNESRWEESLLWRCMKQPNGTMHLKSRTANPRHNVAEAGFKDCCVRHEVGERCHEPSFQNASHLSRDKVVCNTGLTMYNVIPVISLKLRMKMHVVFAESFACGDSEHTEPWECTWRLCTRCARESRVPDAESVTTKRYDRRQKGDQTDRVLSEMWMPWTLASYRSMCRDHFIPH